MDLQILSAIIFFILMGLFLVYKRKNIEVQKIFFPIIYFAMYKTKVGLKAMDRFAKRFERPLGWLSYVSVGLGFLGMIVIVFSLFHNLWKMIMMPGVTPGVGLVLPFKVKGSFYVPFFYWIISIFFIALIHEFSHGIYARLHGIKIKSSGFAFLNLILPIIPAAFVEPDEKQLERSKRKKQLDVLAAGPFSNILAAAVLYGVILLLVPAVIGMNDFTGVNIVDFNGNPDILTSGIGTNETILKIDDSNIGTITDLQMVLLNKTPGDIISVMTDKNSYDITLGSRPENESQAYLGVIIKQEVVVKEKYEKYSWFNSFMKWLVFYPEKGGFGSYGLLMWLVVLNLGIGLFNLAPLGPIDGGKMLLVVLEKYMPKERARMIWRNVSFAFLLLLIANIIPSFF